MRLELEQIKGLRQTLELVASQPGVPGSVFVGIRPGKGVTSFLLTSVLSAEYRVKGELSDKVMAVDRRLLFPFLDSLTDACEFSIDGESLKLKSGKRKADLRLVTPNWSYQTVNVSQFNKYPLPEIFMKTMVHVRSCASDDPVLPEVNCVHVEFSSRSFLFSTNDLILCSAVGSDKKVGVKEAAWAVPTPIIDAIQKLSCSEILVHGQTFAIKTSGGLVWGSAPDKAWKEFPKDRIKKLIVGMRKTPMLLSLKASVLSDLCQQFTKYLSHIPKEEWMIHLKVVSKTVGEIYSKSAYAEFRDEVPIKAASTGEVEVNLALIGSVFLATDPASIISISQAKDSVCYVQTNRGEFLISQRA